MVTKGARGVMGVRAAAYAAAIAPLWVMAPFADAQSPAEPSAAPGEIVVTAQKRAQKVNDVGISIAALSGAEIEDRNVVDVVGLSALVPSLDIAQPNGPSAAPAIYLRGVGLNDFNTNNSGPIAVYSDEVYRSILLSQNFALFDVERVEVIKGPQGTLFGRNATGGALRVISRKPTDELGADVSAEYAEFETHRVDAAVNVPIGEHLAVRLSGIATESDGYVANRALDRNEGGYRYTSGRGQILFEPTAQISNLLSVEVSETRRDGSGYTLQGLRDPADPTSPCAVGAVLAGGCANVLGYVGPRGFLDKSTNLLGRKSTDSTLVSNVATWSGESLTFTSVTSYEDVSSLQVEDTDISPLNIVNAVFGFDGHTFSQELRGTLQTPRTQATLGAFYLTETFKQNQTADTFRDLRALIESLDPVSFPGGFDPTGAAAGAPTLFSRFRNRQTTDTFAVFGQVEQAIGERFKLIGGLRYTDETRDWRTIATLEEPTFTVPVYDIPLSTSASRVNFKVGGEFRPRPGQLLYATVSTGFKSGGFNGGFLLDPAQVIPFKEEELTAYEVGAKLSLADGRVQLNGAAFYYDYKDIQVFTFVNSGSLPVTALTNAGAARIIGVEQDLVWRATDDLTITQSASWLDTEFTRFETAAALGGDDFRGNELPLAPEFTVNAGIAYDHPLTAAMNLTGRVDASYRSRVFFDPSNAPLFAQDGYALVDVSVGLEAPDRRWSIGAFVKNAGDQHYLSYVTDFSSFGFNQRVPGSPRQVGVQTSLRF